MIRKLICGLHYRQGGNLLLVSLVILTVFSSCEDEKVKRDYPMVKTLEVTNISENGATFVGEVYEEGNIEITEHGFVWSMTDLTISTENSDKILLGSFTGTGTYNTDIYTTLQAGTNYYVTAFVKAGEYTVYGDAVEFMSLGSQAPVVSDFQPHSAGWRDTVTIYGKNFSYIPATNKVMVGDQTIYPFFSNDSTIKFFIPSEVVEPSNTVSVSIAGNVAKCSEKLTFISPEIYGFKPKQGYWGDTITFTGKRLWYFGMSTTDGMLMNDFLSCEKINEYGDSVSMRITGNLTTESNNVSLSLGPFLLPSENTFTLLSPQIDSISPDTATWKSVVTLYGRFNQLSEKNTILFGSTSANIIYTRYNCIKVEVPQTLVDLENTLTCKAEPFTFIYERPFILKGPEIAEFSPNTGAIGELVTIKGKYFKKDLTTVKIGEQTAPIETINDSVIGCRVPGNIYGTCALSVTTGPSAVVAEEGFLSTNHRITSVYPVNVDYGDTVTVFGEYFRSGLVWRLGNVVLSPVSLSSGEMKFVIPLEMTYEPARIGVVFNYSHSGISLQSASTSEDVLYLNDFTVTDITPLSGKAGDILEITGTNFGTPSVAFGSVKGTITESSKTNIKVRVPGLSAEEHDINITSGGRTITYPLKYSHSGPWLRLNDLPFLYDYACVFDFGEEVYVATAGASAYNRDVYRFNIDTYGFDKVGDNLNSEIMNPISCVLDGKGYVIGQISSYPTNIAFEVFNPDSMTWRSLPPYPGSQVVNPCIVADDSVIYAGFGRWAISSPTAWGKDFWKYSPKTNSWTSLANFTGSKIYFSNQIYLNGKILFKNGYYFSAELYEYLPDQNVWNIVDDNLPDDASGARVNTDLNGKWYIGFGDSWAFHGSYGVTNPGINNRFYCFDPSTNTWKTMSYVPVSARTFPMSFSAGGYIFIGGSQYTHLYDFWRYDPELDQ